MDFSKLKKLSIGGVELKQMFINGVQIWKSGYKNWVRYSTEADGKTIYNGGLGYKNGCRVRSGGAEATTTNSSCTGFIPIKGLSSVRIGGTDTTFVAGATGQAINVFDSSLTNLGQIVGNSSGGGYGIFSETYAAHGSQTVVQKDNCWEWVAPPDASGIAYIRVTGHTVDGSKLIVTINEEIT